MSRVYLMDESLLALQTRNVICTLLSELTALNEVRDSGLDYLPEDGMQRYLTLILRKVQDVRGNYVNNLEGLSYGFSRTYDPWLKALDRKTEYLRRQAACYNSFDHAGLFSIDNIVDEALRGFD